MIYKIPFIKPNISKVDDTYLTKALNSTAHVMASELENKFSTYVGSKFAIATYNGTTAMHLSLCALDLKRGDKIICSVNAHPAIPEAIRHFDAEPIFVDINLDDFNINIGAFENILKNNKSKKLRGVILSYISGQAVDLEAFFNISREYGIFVLEDASHCLGGTYKGQKIGSMGADISVFSFAPVRSATLGSGGMIVTNNELLHKRAVSLRSHAMTVEDHDGINYIYDVTDVGYDYKISGLGASYCLSEFDVVEKAKKLRYEIAQKYITSLSDLPHVTLPAIKEDHNFYSFIIKIDKNRDGFAKALAKDKIQTSLQYIPLHMMSYYRNKYSLKINSYPNALKNFQQVLSIPIYYKMSEEQVSLVINSITNIAKARIW